MQSKSSSIVTHLTTWLGRVLFVLSLLPLLALAYQGIFTRYLADDYSTAWALSQYGFWGSQAFWYQAWSGRFAFSFLIALVELAGVRLVPWLPASGLLLWGISLFLGLRKFFRILDLPVGAAWVGVLVNCMILGVIRSFREYAQVIFWQTGLLTYQISLIFITLLIGVFLWRFWQTDHRTLSIWEYAAWGVAFLIGGGFSETWVIVQIALTGLAWVGFFIMLRHPLKKEILIVLALGFLASWAALLVIASSPGNMNRDTVMAELSVELLRYAILSAFWDLPRFLGEWWTGNTYLVVFLFMVGGSIGVLVSTSEKSKTVPLWAGLAPPMAGYLLLWAGFVPQFAVMGIRPAERAIFMPMFLFIEALVLSGVFFGAFFGARFAALSSRLVRLLVLAVLVVAILWIPVRVSLGYFRLIPILRLYAHIWDGRDAYLRRAAVEKEMDVRVPSLRRNPELIEIQSTFWVEGDLQDDADHWINQMAAQYYRVSTIRLRK